VKSYCIVGTTELMNFKKTGKHSTTSGSPPFAMIVSIMVFITFA
jgi:acetylornithine/succinyldiaminopimelate/putrescine aminotransferase